MGNCPFQCGVVRPDVLPDVLAAGPNRGTQSRATAAPEMLPHDTQQIPAEGQAQVRRYKNCLTSACHVALMSSRQRKSSRLNVSPCFAPDTTKTALSFLFEDKTHSSFSSTVKDKATSEPIRYIFPTPLSQHHSSCAFF